MFKRMSGTQIKGNDFSVLRVLVIPYWCMIYNQIIFYNNYMFILGSPGKTGRNKIGDRGAKGYKGERSDIIQGPKGKIGDSGLIGPVGPKSQSCKRIFLLSKNASIAQLVRQ